MINFVVFIFIFIIFVLFLPIRFDIYYNNNLKIGFGFLFFKFNILKSRKKKKNSNIQENTKKSKKNLFKNISSFINMLKNSRFILELLRQIIKKIHFKKIHIAFFISSDEAKNCSMDYFYGNRRRYSRPIKL